MFTAFRNIYLNNSALPRKLALRRCQRHLVWTSFSYGSTAGNCSCDRPMTDVASDAKADPAYRDEDTMSSTVKPQGRRPCCHPKVIVLQRLKLTSGLQSSGTARPSTMR